MQSAKYNLLVFVFLSLFFSFHLENIAFAAPSYDLQQEGAVFEKHKNSITELFSFDGLTNKFSLNQVQKNIYAVNKTFPEMEFMERQQIELDFETEVYALGLNGNIRRGEGKSYAHVVLIDAAGTHWELFTTELTADAKEIQLTDFCLESCAFDSSIKPATLEVALFNSMFSLDSLSFSNTPIEIDSSALRTQQTQILIESQRDRNLKEGLNWIPAYSISTTESYNTKRKKLSKTLNEVKEKLPGNINQVSELSKNPLIQSKDLGHLNSSRSRTQILESAGDYAAPITLSLCQNDPSSCLTYDDWRLWNWVSPVKSQGYETTCTTYSYVSALESSIMRGYYDGIYSDFLSLYPSKSHYFYDADLDEDYFQDGCIRRTHNGCYQGSGYIGVLGADAFEMHQNFADCPDQGIYDERCEYTRTSNYCTLSGDKECMLWYPNAGMTYTPILDPDIHSMGVWAGTVKSFTDSIHPAIFSIVVYSDFKSSYASGIYAPASGSVPLNYHGVVSYGYGFTVPGSNMARDFYILIKNSWGSSWAYSGWGYMYVVEPVPEFKSPIVQMFKFDDNMVVEETFIPSSTAVDCSGNTLPEPFQLNICEDSDGSTSNDYCSPTEPGILYESVCDIYSEFADNDCVTRPIFCEYGCPLGSSTCNPPPAGQPVCYEFETQAENSPYSADILYIEIDGQVVAEVWDHCYCSGSNCWTNDYYCDDNNPLGYSQVSLNCASGESCNSSFGTPGHPTKCLRAAAWCDDTDGGVEYSIHGTCQDQARTIAGLPPEVDYCDAANNQVEMYCNEDNRCVWDYQLCENGCNQGEGNRCLEPNFVEDFSVWPYTVAGAAFSRSGTLADIDQDGDLEIIITSWFPDQLYVFQHDDQNSDGDPDLLWMINTNGYAGDSPIAVDLDPSYPGLEIITGGDYPHVWHADGTLAWTQPALFWAGDPAVGDIDNDGNLEVVISDGWFVYALEADGSIMSGWPTNADGITSLYPVLADIDTNGDLEVLIGSQNGGLYAWHHTGSNVSGWPKYTSGPIPGSPAVADFVTTVPGLEVVVGSYDDRIYGWHHNGTTISGWEGGIDTGDDIVSGVVFADLTNDGNYNAIVGSLSGQLYVIKPDGQPYFQSWPKTMGGQFFASPSIAHLDEDFGAEVILESGGFLHALRPDGASLSGFPLNTWWPSPTIADLDDDGHLELVAGYAEEVQILTLPQWTTPNPRPWLIDRGNMQRTGVYDWSPAPAAPCELLSVWISANCGSNGCEEGETITMHGNITGEECPDLIDEFEIDALDSITSPTCRMTPPFLGGNMEPMIVNGGGTNITQYNINATWIIPEVPAHCAGKVMNVWRGVISDNSGGFTYSTTEADTTFYFKRKTGGACFSATTPISLADGTQLPINQIKINDQVVAWDANSNQNTIARVTDLLKRSSTGYYLINDLIEVTPEHPFYVNGIWVTAEELNIGDELTTLTEEQLSVTSKEYVEEETDVYNLTVDGPHTYYAHGVLVHNKKRRARLAEHNLPTGE